MKLKKHLHITALLLFAVTTLTSGNLLANPDQEQMRAWFERAEQIAHLPNSSEYKLLKRRLNGYPLYPYVTQKTLLRYPYISNEKKIANFLSEYEDTPMDRPLRQKWLKHLARQNRPDLFLKYYKDQASNALRCQALVYEIADQAPTEAQFAQIEKLWVQGKSQPRECDPLFAKWQKAGKRTTTQILKRAQLAADGGQSSLLSYLKKLLPDSMKYLADLWLSVRRSPSKITKLSSFYGDYPDIEADIITYGIKRLIWRNPDLALKTWPRAEKKFPFTHAQLQSIKESFAIALAAKNHEYASKWLELASNSTNNPELHRWHLTQVLRDKDWHHAYEVLQQVPEDVPERLSYEYWMARGLEELGQQQQVEAMFQDLSQNRHYYGFLASGKLQQPVKLQNMPLQFSQEQMQTLQSLPAMQRATEFVRLGRYTSARREWNHLMPKLTKQQKGIAAYLADQWNWHDQAIHTFADSGYLDDIEKRFPLAYKDSLISSANKHDVNPAWAFAITRRESSFKADARSSVGAHGLMQLLPSTVQYLERKKVKRTRLYDPTYNIELGNRYLQYLMDKMDGNHVLATASYNAGWRRVKNWIPENEALPLDIWVETIPFKETRNYVKAVLAYKQIYHQLLGYEQNYFTTYAQMKIGEENDDS